MKLIKQNLKVVALFLATLILFQGCTVYKSTPVSVQEAVKTSKKVKIKDENKTYKFNYLEEIDGETYGTIFQYSKTAKLLSNQIAKKNEHKKLVKIKLTQEQLSEIYPKDQKLSNVLTALPFVALSVVLTIALINAINDFCLFCTPEP